RCVYRPLYFTLFPYTTLFRSQYDVCFRVVDLPALFTESGGERGGVGVIVGECGGVVECAVTRRRQHAGLSETGAEHVSDSAGLRSEEHTSELQSRFDLVCRLL